MRNSNVFSVVMNPPADYIKPDESDWVGSPFQRALGNSKRGDLSPRTVVWRPGETSASGIYLVRARTEDGRSASKMVVLVR